MSRKDRPVCIVTGGARGIGEAIVRRFRAEGFAVALLDIDEARGRALAKEVDAHFLRCDVGQPADWEAAVGEVRDQFGRLDVLVNNAGGLIARKTIADMSLEHWQAVMDLNLTSTFLMIKACLPHMTTGAIVNLASQAGRDGGGPGAVAYATSKGAVMTMTRSLAKELGPAIRVNALCPGMIDTDFHNIHTADAARRGFEAAAVVKRQGVPEDVANLVLFLACDESAFITGANIDINGGVLFS